MRKVIDVNYCVAEDLMNSLFTLYQCVALSAGLDIEDEVALVQADEEGRKWTQRKFISIAEEFEHAFGFEFNFVCEEEEE